jgi:hypothetical protein
MDVRRDGRSASTSEGASAMSDETRRRIGSVRFGIEPRGAPVEDFPRQPSQKDGLGRMCKTHWNEYTKGLAREAKARKAAESGEAVDAAAVTPQAATQRKRSRKAPAAEAGG